MTPKFRIYPGLVSVFMLLITGASQFCKKMISSVSRKAHIGYKRAFRLALQIYAHRDAPLDYSCYHPDSKTILTPVFLRVFYDS